LDGVDIDAGSDAVHATDDVGDVGAVAGPGAVVEGIGVGFDRVGAAGPIGAHEVVAPHDLVGGEGAGLDHGRIVGGVVGRISRSAEIGVVIVDAGVDHGDRDPRAVVA